MEPVWLELPNRPCPEDDSPGGCNRAATAWLWRFPRLLTLTQQTQPSNPSPRSGIAYRSPGPPGRHQLSEPATRLPISPLATPEASGGPYAPTRKHYFYRFGRWNLRPELFFFRKLAPRKDGPQSAFKPN